MTPSPVVLEAVRMHAACEAPDECCGLVISEPFHDAQVYVPCRNLRKGEPDRFVIDPRDWADAEDRGHIAAVCHSHVNRSPVPSQADLIGCERLGVPWLIVNYPVGHWVLTEPSGYVAPYVGREFVYGVCDCWTLARDWYARERGLQLPEIAYEDAWWQKGGDLYTENFERCGFRRVEDEPQVGDAFLMHVRSPVPNHAGIYVGAGKILHHLQGALSRVDVYGGQWRKRTAYRVRYFG